MSGGVDLGGLFVQLGLKDDFSKQLVGVINKGAHEIKKMAAEFAGVAIGVGIFKQIVEAASEAEQSHAQLVAVLKSTKRGSEETAEALEGQAKAFSRVSIFADDAIVSAQTVALKYTHIGGDVFPMVTQAAMDMSARLGTDLSSSMNTLGRALDDPTRGLQTLRRQGVTFTDEQKELVKHMMAVGNVAGAQKLELEVLAKKYEGAAAAARNTLGGSLKALRNSFDSLFESLGKTAMSPLRDVVEAIIQEVRKFEDEFGNMADGMAGKTAPLVDAIHMIGSALRFAAENIDIVTAAVEALLAKKVINWFIDAIGATGKLSLNFAAQAAAQNAAAAAAATAAEAEVAATAAAQRAAVAMEQAAASGEATAAIAAQAATAESAAAAAAASQAETNAIAAEKAAIASKTASASLAGPLAITAAALVGLSMLIKNLASTWQSQIESMVADTNDLAIAYKALTDKAAGLTHMQLQTQLSEYHATEGALKVEKEQAVALATKITQYEALRAGMGAAGGALDGYIAKLQMESRDLGDSIRQHTNSQKVRSQLLGQVMQGNVALKGEADALGLVGDGLTHADSDSKKLQREIEKLIASQKAFKEANKALAEGKGSKYAETLLEVMKQFPKANAKEIADLVDLQIKVDRVADAWKNVTQWKENALKGVDTSKLDPLVNSAPQMYRIGDNGQAYMTDKAKEYLEGMKTEAEKAAEAMAKANAEMKLMGFTDEQIAQWDRLHAVALEYTEDLGNIKHIIESFNNLTGIFDAMANSVRGVSEELATVFQSMGTITDSLSKLASIGVTDWSSFRDAMKKGGQEADEVAQSIVAAVQAIGAAMKAMNVGASNQTGGISQFGGRKEGNYAAEGSMVGSIIGGIIASYWGATAAGMAIGGAIGTVVGGLIAKAGDSASGDLVNGVISFGETSDKLNNAVLDAFRQMFKGVNDVLDHLGVYLNAADMPFVSFKIRDEMVRVIVGYVQRAFASMQDAISFAIAEVVKQAGAAGGSMMPPELKAALQNTKATSLEELNSDIAFAKKIAYYGLPEIVKKIDDTVGNFFADMRHAAELGIDTTKVGKMFVDQMQQMKDDILGINKTKSPQEILQENIKAYNDRIEMLRAEAQVNQAELLLKKLDIETQIAHLRSEINVTDARARLYSEADTLAIQQLGALQDALAAINSQLAAEQVIIDGLTAITDKEAADALARLGKGGRGGGGKYDGGQSLQQLIDDQNLAHSQIGMSDFGKKLAEVNKKWDEATAKVGLQANAEEKAKQARDKAIDAARRSGKTQEEIDKAIKAANDKYAQQIKHIHKTKEELDAANKAREQEIADLIAEQQKNVTESYNQFMGIGQDPIAQLTKTFGDLKAQIIEAQYPMEKTGEMLYNLTEEYNRQVDALIRAGRAQAMSGVQSYIDTSKGIGKDQRALIDVLKQFDDARENLRKVADAAAAAGESTDWLAGDLADLDRAQRVAVQQIAVNFIGSLKSLGANLPADKVRELAKAQWNLAKVQALAAAVAIEAAHGFDGLAFSFADVVSMINSARFEDSSFFPQMEQAAGATQDAANAAQQLADRLANAKKSIAELLNEMAGGKLGSVGARDALNYAQQHYQDVLALAKGGDLSALESITSVSRDYMDALKMFSPSLFNLMFPQIEKDLSGLLSIQTAHESNVLTSVLFQAGIDQQIAASRETTQATYSVGAESVSQLSDLNRNVVALKDASDQQAQQFATLTAYQMAQKRGA